MINIDSIKEFINGHSAPYIYNSKSFEPGKTSIYYSGPYWDNKEIEAAINALVNGKWVTTGEMYLNLKGCLANDSIVNIH